MMSTRLEYFVNLVNIVQKMLDLFYVHKADKAHKSGSFGKAGWCLQDVIRCKTLVPFVRPVNIMQRRPDVIKPTSPGVLARPVDIIQRGTDLITPTTLVDNVQSKPDLIKAHKCGGFCKGGQYYTKKTRPYKVHTSANFLSGRSMLHKVCNSRRPYKAHKAGSYSQVW